MFQIKQDDCIYSLIISEPRRENDENDFLEFLEKIIHNEKFILILEVDGKKTFSLAAKKRLNLWFKNNKNILKARCLGFVRVNPDATKMSKLKSKAFTLAMPCTYKITNTESEAIDFAKKLL